MRGSRAAALGGSIKPPRRRMGGGAVSGPANGADPEGKRPAGPGECLMSIDVRLARTEERAARGGTAAGAPVGAFEGGAGAVRRGLEFRPRQTSFPAAGMSPSTGTASIRLDVGVEMSAPFTPSGDIIASATPAGMNRLGRRTSGDYSRLGSAHEAVHQFCKQHGQQAARPQLGDLRPLGPPRGTRILRSSGRTSSTRLKGSEHPASRLRATARPGCAMRNELWPDEGPGGSPAVGRAVLRRASPRADGSAALIR